MQPYPQRKATAFSNIHNAYLLAFLPALWLYLPLLAIGRTTINNPETSRATLMHLSLGQAAKETGMNKSTLSRAIKNGKLSATRQENGGYAIDPAELFRVFAPAPKDTEPPG